MCKNKGRAFADLGPLCIADLFLITVCIKLKTIQVSDCYLFIYFVDAYNHNPKPMLSKMCDMSTLAKVCLVGV